MVYEINKQVLIVRDVPHAVEKPNSLSDGTVTDDDTFDRLHVVCEDCQQLVRAILTKEG